MLHFTQLSHWERRYYLDHIDFCIVGAGIIGMCTALSLKSRYPSAKILLLERGYIPTGASTKNAGFACFGSPTELHDDLQHIPAQKVWETVQMRFEGLKRLQNWVSPEQMRYRPCGSYDLIRQGKEKLPDEFIAYLNQELMHVIGINNVYSTQKEALENFGFSGFQNAYFNKAEGSLETDFLIEGLYKRCVQDDIRFLFSTSMLDFESDAAAVTLETTNGPLSCQHLFLCTNGFSQRYFPDELKPARAQVLVTKPLNHTIRGTFHLDEGYYYFRDIGERILFGGGRNLDFETESSTEFEANSNILNVLEARLRNEILSGLAVEIEHSWSGIMSVGAEKKPIIRSLNKNVHAGVRMGGMGVAIGAAVGHQLSQLV
ncbi:MAG: hypothetical protein RLZZ301_229 [Bacteroidota bacterium]